MTARIDRGDVTPFLQPWTMDAWGSLRPPVSRKGIRLSLELAASVYAMAVDPWMEAGWQDVTAQVDGRLTRLTRGGEHLRAAWKQFRVRSRIYRRDPVTQVVGVMRQRDASSSGKALVMLHKAQDGRYVVAISFMGTGARLYDWISNFRMTTQDGVHKGFAQLCAQFEDNEEVIEFPAAAREMGLEKLTLRHILQEMKRQDSRFVLWLSGHSQGAAIMQVYAHRKITEEGVLPGNVTGYGFASPSVMTGQAVDKPAAYPLYHILNSDDLFPRCGAQVHLGVCLTCPADEALRRRCYNWPRDAESVEARLAVRPVLRRLQDTPSAIVQLTAYLRLLSRQSGQAAAELLGVGDTLSRIIGASDISEVLRAVGLRLMAAYQCITGMPLPQEQLVQAEAQMNQVISQIGLKRFSSALSQLIRYPHRLPVKRGDVAMSAYRYIACYALDALMPSCWQPGQPPRRLTAPGPMQAQ